MSVNERFEQHAKLVARMADTLGVDLTEEMQRGNVDAEDLRQIVQKCTGCTGAGECTHWLDQHAGGAKTAPSYCRNAEQFLHLRD